MRKNLFTMILYLTLILVCSVAFLLFLRGQSLGTDRRPPAITFAEETPELSARDPREALLQGVTATDDRDGDVTDSLVVADIRLLTKDGTARVTYAAFDAAGNVTKASRNVKFTDYRSPRLSLTTGLTFNQNTKFDLFSIVKAEDMLDGDISHRVRIMSLDEDGIANAGSHKVQVNVSNSMGETVSLVLPVEVYAAGTYQATLELTDYLVYLPVGGTLDTQSYLASYIRSNANVSLKDGLPEGFHLEVKSKVQTRVPGVYTVDYWVTQTVNGVDYTGYARLIVVVEG